MKTRNSDITVTDRPRRGSVCLRHGLSYTPEYRAWQMARHRCTSPKSAAYRDYGGRGIRMCDEWLDDPRAFVNHVGPRPSSKHELDRIDNDGHYAPGNVRWVLRSVNCRNRRSTHMITFQNESRPLVEWCEMFGLRVDVVLKRINAGFGVERALSEPVAVHSPRGQHKPRPKCVDCGVDVYRVRCKSCENRRRWAQRRAGLPAALERVA